MRSLRDCFAGGSIQESKTKTDERLGERERGSVCVCVWCFHVSRSLPKKNAWSSVARPVTEIKRKDRTVAQEGSEALITSHSAKNNLPLFLLPHHPSRTIPSKRGSPRPPACRARAGPFRDFTVAALFCVVCRTRCGSMDTRRLRFCRNGATCSTNHSSLVVPQTTFALVASCHTPCNCYGNTASLPDLAVDALLELDQVHVRRDASAQRHNCLYRLCL